MRRLSEDIYKTVVEYLKTRNENNWKWFYGSQAFTAKEIIQKMEKDKKFRKLIINEVVKTATDLFARSK